MENLFKKNLRFAIISLSIIVVITVFSIYRAIKGLEMHRQRGQYLMDAFTNPNTEAGKEAIRIHEEWEYIRAGDKYQKEGKYDLAIEEYKKAEEMAEGSDKWVSKKNLARVYEKSGQYDLALEEIEWLISEGPRTEVIKELHGWKAAIIYQKEGKYDLAIAEYKKVIGMAEGAGKWRPKESLARLYEKTSQYALAIKELDWLISEVDRKEDREWLKNWKSRLEKLKAAKAAEGK